MSNRANRWVWGAAAAVGIWLTAAAMAIWSPDLVTGAAHEHLPLIAITVPIWALLATGLVVMAPALSASGRSRVWATYAGVVVAFWVAAAAVSIWAPTMVTGTDPTTIPIAGIFAPIVAMAATAYATVAVVAVGAREESLVSAIDDVVRRIGAPAHRPT